MLPDEVCCAGTAGLCLIWLWAVLWLSCCLLANACFRFQLTSGRWDASSERWSAAECSTRAAITLTNGPKSSSSWARHRRSLCVACSPPFATTSRIGLISPASPSTNSSLTCSSPLLVRILALPVWLTSCLCCESLRDFSGHLVDWLHIRWADTRTGAFPWYRSHRSVVKDYRAAGHAGTRFYAEASANS